jgi:hypothetical protein
MYSTSVIKLFFFNIEYSLTYYIYASGFKIPT